jgi:hypothetical protein
MSLGEVSRDSTQTQYTEPAIQLLEYADHPGSYGVRFC